MMGIKQNQDNQMTDYELPLPNGMPALSFPLKTIDNLRYMITRLQRDNPLPARLGLVSALRGEGVTYISYALSATLANDLPVSVCLVDLNWHWPFKSPFDQSKSGGVSGIVNGSVSLDDALVPTGLPNFFILPAGPVEKKRLPIIARSAALRTLVEQLSQRFDHLILDIPAILSTSDAIALAGLATGLAVVIRQGATPDSDVRAALDDIRHMPVFGTILNDARYHSPAGLVNLLVGHE